MLAYRPRLRRELVYLEKEGEGHGAIHDPVVKRLEALDIERAYPDLAGQPWFDVAEWKDDHRVLYLATVGERCVFLRDDRRCGLHAAFGADAKPGFCRLYPIQALPTIDGLKI